MNKPSLLPALLLALLPALSCSDPRVTFCDTGVLCPDGTQCAARQPICIIGDCGNGVLDSGEECDDGNVLNGDGCSATCVREGCGNGIVDVAIGEVCDDGNTVDGDGCSADCRTNERCGNGVIDRELGEVCDDGNNASGDGCSADCLSVETCGNGYIDLAVGEECEPRIAIPDALALQGVRCAADCRYSYANATVEAPTAQAQMCRLSLFIREGRDRTGQPLAFPARVISDKGGIDCQRSGGSCTSSLIACGQDVLLVATFEGFETAAYGLMEYFSWNHPGCYPDNLGVTGAAEPNIFSCSVHLDAGRPDVSLTLGSEVPTATGGSASFCGVQSMLDACGIASSALCRAEVEAATREDGVETIGGAQVDCTGSTPAIAALIDCALENGAVHDGKLCPLDDLDATFFDTPFGAVARERCAQDHARVSDFIARGCL